ncbi:MAG: (2Fe-2S)-binding protein [Bacteroidales bacterium]|nr:(2Fe-2S)-binding protein [Bacteroidales bacterium]
MKITLNGKIIEAKQGQTIFQAARDNGIYIPTLCYHEKTGPAGKCRACVVEVEGMRGLQTSCSVLAKDGMVVTSNSENVLDAQRLVVDLLLSTGRHNCLSCEKNGNCDLQKAAYYLGIEVGSFQYADMKPDIDDSSEFIQIDRSKCISCGRCIAACNNVVVNNVLNFGYRGHETQIVFDTNLPMGGSSCVQCGECSQLCPVGAIIDKRAVGKGREWEFDKVETICPYCGVGCNLELNVDRKTNSIVKIRGVEDAPTNEGMLCVKGRYGFDFVGSDERLTTPLIKDADGEFREASWEEATDLIVEKLSFIRDTYGPDTIMGLTSAKATNEENYTFQKLIRTALKTNNVDHCARL